MATKKRKKKAAKKAVKRKVRRKVAKKAGKRVKVTQLQRSKPNPCSYNGLRQ